MPPVGFEPTISVDKRTQNYASDRAATVTVIYLFYGHINGISLNLIKIGLQTRFMVVCRAT